MNSQRRRDVKATLEKWKVYSRKIAMEVKTEFQIEKQISLRVVAQKEENGTSVEEDAEMLSSGKLS